MTPHAPHAVALPVRRSLPILDSGSCEPFKAAIHGAALGLAALMGAYNAAAWLRRRQPHLAVNAAIYIGAAIWEQRNVAHHLAACTARKTATAAFAQRAVYRNGRRVA